VAALGGGEFGFSKEGGGALLLVEPADLGVAVTQRTIHL
jgi:hypothetical protein